MATAQTFIESALRKIQIKGAETPLSTQELTDGLEVLNDMGAQLEVEGFELGFTTLSVVGDTVTVPAYSNEFYKLQLAARLATEYAVPFNDSLVASLQAARRSVIRELNRKAVGQSGTFQNIIYGAFELSGVKSGQEPISTTEITNALPMLDDLIYELESDGFRLNYSPASAITESHGLPDWSWSWIKATLAARIASSLSMPPNEVAMALSQKGEKAAYRRFATVPEVDYPDTLPMGQHRDTWDSIFYSNTSHDDLLTGTGNALLDDEGLPLERDL